MFDAIKKMWRYLRNYKLLLFLSILSLIIGQILIFLTPLVIKQILDEQLVGIANYPWAVVTSHDKQTVTYDELFLKQTRYLTDEELDGKKLYYIYADDKSFYFTDYDVVENDFTIENATVIDENNEAHLTEQLGRNDLINFYRPTIKPLFLLITSLFGLAVGSIIFGYAQRRLNADITINITRDARLDAAVSVHQLSIADIENEPAGKLSSRIITDVSGLMMMFSILMNIVFGATLSMIFAAIGMIYLNSTLAIIFLAAIPFIIIWMNYFIKKIRRIASKVAETSSLIIAHINEVINGINILKVFNYKKPTTKKFTDLSTEFFDEMMTEVKTHATIGWNMIEMIRKFAVIAVIIYFSWAKFGMTGVIISSGTIYAYNDYISNIINPINAMFRQFGELQHSIVKTNRLFRLIDGGTENNEIQYLPRFKGDIKFEKVSFSYNSDGEYVLKDINLKINAGETIGVVGHTGSGKSSLMNLLVRFYNLDDSSKGHIYVDDINISTVPKRSYRQHVGIILQEPVLFSGTIASNIVFGKEGIYDRDIEEVIDQIGARPLIDKFENGIHQKVEFGGKNLSLGEKQIISFARALIHDPAVLIMDEATANIDTETEKLIQNALQIISKDRTTIIIAHRLSTIMNADQIVVMENGKIIELGEHQELIKSNKVYANMYRSQVEI